MCMPLAQNGAFTAIVTKEHQQETRCWKSNPLVSVVKKGKGSPYSITEHRVPELIPFLGSQPAGDDKPGCRLPLHSARPAVTPASLKRAATNSAAW